MKARGLQQHLKQAGFIGLAILVPGGIIVLLFVSLLRLARARTLARHTETLRAA